MSINPVVALLILPTVLVLVLVIASMIVAPATFYTFKYQLIVMIGLGLLWLLCQFLVEEG